jgi:hypothetical protein
LYRYVAERYVPLKVDKFIYLVHPDRLAQLKTRISTIAPTAKLEVGDTQDRRLKLLDEVFLIENLKKIPRSWGLSFESLRSTLQPVQPLNLTSATLQGIEKTDSSTYRVTSNAPAVTFNVENLNLKGRDAGLLAFEFSSRSPRVPMTLKVDWQSDLTQPASRTTPIRLSAKKGMILVPLDAAPRWLLAKKVKTIRVAIEAPVVYSFTMSTFTLFQRSELQALPNPPDFKEITQ